MSNYLDQLSQFACEISYDRLSDSARTAAAEVLMDTIGAIIGGSRLPENANLARFAATQAGGTATLIGHPQKAPPPMAALANATAGVALEMDEGTRLGGGHPAIHVLPRRHRCCRRPGLQRPKACRIYHRRLRSFLPHRRRHPGPPKRPLPWHMGNHRHRCGRRQTHGFQPHPDAWSHQPGRINESGQHVDALL